MTDVESHARRMRRALREAEREWCRDGGPSPAWEDVMERYRQVRDEYRRVKALV